ncbi:hypothetical protein DH2020_012975 [Rehmannia glutinosa]|uniref:Acyltransferase-like protein n=1 Tax=Rehmannia glutinosa TaxID=99300 RepID=A0ABR0X169_REHGL
MSSDMVQREQAVKKSRDLLFIEVGKGFFAKWIAHFHLLSTISVKEMVEEYLVQTNEFADSVSNKMFTVLRKLLGFNGNGIDGVGLGLKLHHQRLAESEHERAPKRPIYLVGESFGASLALIVAAQNPDVDLVLILANPATSLSKSLLQNVGPLSDMIHKHLLAGLPHAMSLIPVETILWKLKMTHDMQNYLNSHLHSVKAQTLVLNSGKDMLLSSLTEGEKLHNMLQRCEVRSFIGNGDPLFLQFKDLSKNFSVALPSISKITGRGMAAYIKFSWPVGVMPLEVVLMASLDTGTDGSSPFQDKPKKITVDDTFDLVAAIKRASYYRRGESIDYISDFLPPTPSEFKAVYEPFRWMDVAFNPVMLSTMDDGKIVRGFAGIPSEGPVLFVGNHMMLAMESFMLLPRILMDQDILVRVLAHPVFFQRMKDGMLPDLSVFDIVRVIGGLPVSAKSLYRLFSLKSHVMLYPGGVREAFHHKGEEYKLIWPAEPEFVRMAAKFGATIIPFGGVAEDDVLQLLLDSDEQMKIPALKDFIERLNNETVRLRGDVEGEVGKQSLYFPIFLPKLPGRAYFLFGKPISTKGREDILRNKDKACEMYIEVQNEIEKCIAFLKEKREKDPYRNLLDRVAYQGSNGFHSEVPTFDI